jgi:hypothetical protein
MCIVAWSYMSLSNASCNAKSHCQSSRHKALQSKCAKHVLCEQKGRLKKRLHIQSPLGFELAVSGQAKYYEDQDVVAPNIPSQVTTKEFRRSFPILTPAKAHPPPSGDGLRITTYGWLALPLFKRQYAPIIFITRPPGTPHYKPIPYLSLGCGI